MFKEVLAQYNGTASSDVDPNSEKTLYAYIVDVKERVRRRRYRKIGKAIVTSYTPLPDLRPLSRFSAQALMGSKNEKKFVDLQVLRTERYIDNTGGFGHAETVMYRISAKYLGEVGLSEMTDPIDEIEEIIESEGD